MKFFVLEKHHAPDSPYLGLDFGARLFAKPSAAPAGAEVTFSVKANERDNPPVTDFQMIGWPAFSEKLKAVIDAFGPEGMEWIPAKGSIGGSEYTYWILHPLERIDCIDTEASDIEWDDDVIDEIESLVLKEDVLDQVDPKKTLIFEMAGKSKVLVAESVAAAMQDSGCDGFALVPVEEWNTDYMLG